MNLLVETKLKQQGMDNPILRLAIESDVRDTAERYVRDYRTPGSLDYFDISQDARTILDREVGHATKA